MLILLGFFTIIILAITAIRIGAIALELTGLSPEIAAFQAQSAFSGTGFTTEESETIVSHPVRRRIVRLLILTGNAGITSIIAGLILTFLAESTLAVTTRVLVLLAGLIIIFFLSRSKLIYFWMRKIIKKALNRYTSLSLLDYQEILGLRKGYTVCRIKIKRNSWMDGKRLDQLNLPLEGVLILSIHRNSNGKEKFIGAPQASTVIKENDILICYGRGQTSKELSNRNKGKAGDLQHRKEIEKERKITEAEKEIGATLQP